MSAFEDFVDECVSDCVNARVYRLTEDETYRSYREELHDLGLDDEQIEKAVLCRHLWNHGVLLSTAEYAAMSLAAMQRLDPCLMGDVG